MMQEGEVRERVGLRLILAAALTALGSAAGAGEAAPRHLIYLHGRIVQDQQSARPRHPEWGYYELEAIRATFRQRGFVVTSEIRPKNASISESADRVVGQVRELVASGVPKYRITVVGASFRETSDETSEPCPAWSDDEAGRATLRVREIVLSTGQHHGFLYRPLPEWVDPLVAWATLR